MPYLDEVGALRGLKWSYLTSSPEAIRLNRMASRPVRPAHLLAGVTRVAPYSSRRQPPAPKARKREYPSNRNSRSIFNGTGVSVV